MTEQTTSPSKEAEFKQRFTAVLKDLQEVGSQDGEAMALVGSLAGELAAKLNQASWTGAKSVMTGETYSNLLKTFETQGNEHHKAGRIKHSYAIQLLSISLIAATQRADAIMAAGEQLLDGVIDHTVSVYNTQKAKPKH